MGCRVDFSLWNWFYSVCRRLLWNPVRSHEEKATFLEIMLPHIFCTPKGSSARQVMTAQAAHFATPALARSDDYSVASSRMPAAAFCPDNTAPSIVVNMGCLV